MLAKVMAAHGLTAFGVCAFAPLRERLLPCRAMSRLPEAARSVIVAAFPYRFAGEGRRNVSYYAAVPDYHRVVGDVLRSAAAQLSADGHRYEVFVDNSPIPEVEAAVRCGLGVRGDNGLLITPQFGSWVFIGCIVTDASLRVTTPLPETVCRHCGACAAACPGRCLPGEDRSNCASHLSQKKGALTEEQERIRRSSGLVWGCDICQEVCPLNAAAAVQPHPCFSWYRPYITAHDLDDLTDKAYGWRGDFFRYRLEE